MNEIAYNSIILHLSDHIIRQVDVAKTARALQIALDKLFLTKTLPNKIQLLEKLVSFRTNTEKDLEINLSDFSIIVKSFAHNEKKFNNQDFGCDLIKFIA